MSGQQQHNEERRVVCLAPRCALRALPGAALCSVHLDDYLRWKVDVGGSAVTEVQS